MAEVIKSVTPEKLALFRALFTGLKNVYGSRDMKTGQIHQVKSPVTDNVLLDHLEGKKPYGVYLLVNDRIGASVVDFDTENISSPAGFLKSAGRLNLPAYIERSRSKGYHIWQFYYSPVPAWKARSVIGRILNEINEPNTEIFPKQDRLDTRTHYGNFIFAPLFGRLVSQNRTVFMDPNDPTKPYPDQWELMENVQRVSESLLDDIIEMNPIDEVRHIPVPYSPANVEINTLGLMPCAQRILREGVCRHQRVITFRLGVQFRRVCMPQDLAVVTLKAWAHKNKPTDGKQIITESEIIAQVSCAYEKGYRGFGCEDPVIKEFCDPRCPLKRNGRTKKEVENGSNK
jgi:hypothetical protein